MITEQVMRASRLLILITFLLGLGWNACFGVGTQLGYSVLGSALIVVAGFFSILVDLKGSQSLMGSAMFRLVVLTACYFVVRADNSLLELEGVSDMMLILAGGSAWIFSYGFSQNKKITRSVSVFFAVLAVVNTGIAFAQYWGNQLSIWDEIPNEAHRSGLFYHRNYFAAFENIVLLHSLAMSLWLTNSERWRLFYAVIALICLAGLAISQSRGATIGLFGGFVWFLGVSSYLAFKLRPKRAWFYLSFSTVISLLGLLTAVMYWIKTSNERYGSSAASLLADNGRFESLWLAIKVGMDAPLIGKGARAFEYECIPRWGSSTMWEGSGNLNFVHNEYGQIFSDYGLIGLGCCLLILVGHLIFGLWSLLKLSGRHLVPGGIIADKPAYVLGSTSSLVAVGIQAHFCFLWHSPAVWIPLAWFCGLILSNQGSMLPFTKIRRLIQLSFVMIFALLCLYGVFRVIPWLQVLPAELRMAKILPTKPNDESPFLEILSEVPDWRRQKLYAESLAPKPGQNQMTEELLEKRLQAYEKVLEWHPKEVGSHLARAGLLSEMGRYEEAEKEFRWVMDYAVMREYWYRQHRLYALHHYRWGAALHMKRKPELALAHLLRAREAMEYRVYGDEFYRQTFEKLKQYISSLEEAGIEPEVLEPRPMTLENKSTRK